MKNLRVEQAIEAAYLGAAVSHMGKWKPGRWRLWNLPVATSHFCYKELKDRLNVCSGQLDFDQAIIFAVRRDTIELGSLITDRRELEHLDELDMRDMPCVEWIGGKENRQSWSMASFVIGGLWSATLQRSGSCWQWQGVF
jgi:hypothetical protein